MKIFDDQQSMLNCTKVHLIISMRFLTREIIVRMQIHAEGFEMTING